MKKIFIIKNIYYIIIKNMEFIVFTDGSSNLKLRKGGIGVYINDEYYVSYNFDKNTLTNQNMELIAAIYGINLCIKISQNYNTHIDKIILYTDSEYTIKSVSQWAFKQKKNGWTNSSGKIIANYKLIKYFHNLYLNYPIQFIHTRGHQKEPAKNDPNYWIWKGNDNVDKLANYKNK